MGRLSKPVPGRQGVVFCAGYVVVRESDGCEFFVAEVVTESGELISLVVIDYE